MSIAVVDALATIVFFEPAAAVARDRLRRHQLVAPRLLAYELMNAAVKKLRKHPGQERLIREGLSKALGDEFDISWSDVDAGEVLELATETGLTTYDASYLWLACRKCSRSSAGFTPLAARGEGRRPGCRFCPVESHRLHGF